MGQSHSPSKEELRALLEQSNRRAEQERQRAETLKQRADEMEERYRKTTFAEYLQACHQFISKPISIQQEMNDQGAHHQSIWSPLSDISSSLGFSLCTTILL